MQVVVQVGSWLFLTFFRQREQLQFPQHTGHTHVVGSTKVFSIPYRLRRHCSHLEARTGNTIIPQAIQLSLGGGCSEVVLFLEKQNDDINLREVRGANWTYWVAGMD